MKLIIRNLHKSFGELHVLNGIQMELDHSRIYCLMGPSGSGKTTLFRILMGLENTDAGDIIWSADGSTAQPSAPDPARPGSTLFSTFSLHRAPTEASATQPVSTAPSAALSDSSQHPGSALFPLRSVPAPEASLSPRFSAVFQEDRLCEAFTPVENVMMAAGKRLSEKQARAELCRLLPEESLSRPVFTLSGGMKRRTAICRALLAPFDVLLMDEPFTGLDEETRSSVISYIKEKTAGKLVLLSTHQEEDVRLLDAKLLTLSPSGRIL